LLKQKTCLPAGRDDLAEIKIISVPVGKINSGIFSINCCINNNYSLISIYVNYQSWKTLSLNPVKTHQVVLNKITNII